WNLYNARVHRGEHVRVFPISNWTELDVWQYIARERLAVPAIYLAHERAVVRRGSQLMAGSFNTQPRAHEGRGGDFGGFPAPGRHHLYSPRGLGRRKGRCDHRRDRRDHDHRARRDAPRRSDPRGVDGATQARGVLLMSAIERLDALDHGVLRFLTAGSV